MANEKKQRQKSAKDIAWDREREKWQRRIYEAKKAASYWQSCEEAALSRVSYLEEILADQENDIERLAKKANISVQEIKDHIERVKKIEAAVKGMKGINRLATIIPSLY